MCEPLASRDVGDRVRHLYTPGDYAALAVGETNLGSSGVKFIVDLTAGGTVHFLSTRDWALHYTFIREQIDHEAPLDRCDAAQSQAFDQGWYEFSEREYFRSAGRRYLLGTLTTYAGSGLQRLRVRAGRSDRRRANAARLLQRGEPHGRRVARALVGASGRAASERRARARSLASCRSSPSNEPFRNLRYQPLTEGVAFGVLALRAGGGARASQPRTRCRSRSPTRCPTICRWSAG